MLERLKNPTKAPLGRPRARKADRSAIERHLSEVSSILGPLADRHMVRLAYAGMLELEQGDRQPSNQPAMKAHFRWLALEREREAHPEEMLAGNYNVWVPSEGSWVMVSTIKTYVRRNAAWLLDK